MPTEIALVGCHNTTELIGRISTAIQGVPPAEEMQARMLPLQEAIPVLENVFDIMCVDTLSKHPAMLYGADAPRQVTATFRSRLNEKVSCTFTNVSQKTFLELQDDLVYRSGLWYTGEVVAFKKTPDRKRNKR